MRDILLQSALDRLENKGVKPEQDLSRPDFSDYSSDDPKPIEDPFADIMGRSTSSNQASQPVQDEIDDPFADIMGRSAQDDKATDLVKGVNMEDPFADIMGRTPQVAQQRPKDPSQEDPISFREELKRGFDMGVAGVKQGYFGSRAMLAGDEETRERFLDKYNKISDQIQQNPISTPEFTSIRSINDAARWFVGNSGAMAPIVGSIMAGGIAGGLVGGKIGSVLGPKGTLIGGAVGAVKGGMKGFLARQALAAGAKSVGAYVGKMLGSTMGSFTMGYGLYAGSMYGDIREMGGEHEESKRAALVYGVPASAISIVVPAAASASVVGAFGRQWVKDRMKSSLVGVGLGVPAEGFAEAVAESFVIMGEESVFGSIYTPEEKWNRIINAGAVGAVMGAQSGLLGGAGMRQGSVDQVIDRFLDHVEAQDREVARPVVKNYLLSKLKSNKLLSPDQQQLVEYLESGTAESNRQVSDNVNRIDEITTMVHGRESDQNQVRLDELLQKDKTNQLSMDESIELSAIMFNYPKVYRAMVEYQEASMGADGTPQQANESAAQSVDEVADTVMEEINNIGKVDILNTDTSPRMPIRPIVKVEWNPDAPAQDQIAQLENERQINEQYLAEAQESGDMQLVGDLQAALSEIDIMTRELKQEAGTLDTSQPVSRAVDDPNLYTYDGEVGYITTEGQQTVFISQDGSKVYELGNTNDLQQSNTQIGDVGLERVSQHGVEVGADFSVTIGGETYVNKISNPMSAIEFDSDGNVARVHLETENGQKRTFRGSRAESIAYQYQLRNFEDNATAEQIEALTREAEQSQTQESTEQLASEQTESVTEQAPQQQEVKQAEVEDAPETTQATEEVTEQTEQAETTDEDVVKGFFDSTKEGEGGGSTPMFQIGGAETTSQTESTPFKRWFGKSQVVDSDGNPLVVYHGTGSDIDSFDLSKATDKEGRRLNVGLGRNKFYFTMDSGIASRWAENSPRRKSQRNIEGNQPNVMPVYLKVENPISESEYQQRIRDKFPEGEHISGAKRDKAIAQVDAEIKREGYDGIIDDEMTQIAVFSPTQIKSATGNQGTFDGNDPNISAQASILKAEPERKRLISEWAETIKGAFKPVLDATAKLVDSKAVKKLEKISKKAFAFDRDMGDTSLVKPKVISYVDIGGKSYAVFPSDWLVAGMSENGVFEMGGVNFPNIKFNVDNGIIWAVDGNTTLEAIKENGGRVLVSKMDFDPNLSNRATLKTWVESVKESMSNMQQRKMLADIKKRATALGKNGSIVTPEQAEAINSVKNIDDFMSVVNDFSMGVRAVIMKDSLTDSKKVHKTVRGKLQQLAGVKSAQEIVESNTDPLLIGRDPGEIIMVLEVDVARHEREGFKTYKELGLEGVEHPNYKYPVFGKVVGVLGDRASIINSSEFSMDGYIRDGAQGSVSPGRLNSKGEEMTAKLATSNENRRVQYMKGKTLQGHPDNSESGPLLDAPLNTPMEIMTSILNTAFPNIQATVDRSTFNDLLNTEGVQRFLNVSSEVYGLIHEGKVYLNPDFENFNTPMHEFGHVWLDTAQKERPKVFNAGVRLIKNTDLGQFYMDAVMGSTEYKRLAGEFKTKAESETYLIKEALAMFIGDKGESYVKAAADSTTVKESSAYKQALSWLKSFFDYVKNSLNVRGFTSFKGMDSATLADLTMHEFGDLVISELASGEVVSDISSSKLSELMGGVQQSLQVGDGEGGSVLDSLPGEVRQALESVASKIMGQEKKATFLSFTNDMVGKFGEDVVPYLSDLYMGADRKRLPADKFPRTPKGETRDSAKSRKKIIDKENLDKGLETDEKMKSKYIQRRLQDASDSVPVNKKLEGVGNYQKQSLQQANIEADKLLLDFKNEYGEKTSLRALANSVKNNEIPDIMFGAVTAKVIVRFQRLGLNREALELIDYVQTEGRSSGRKIVSLRSDASPEQTLSLALAKLDQKKQKKLDEQFKDGKTYRETVQEVIETLREIRKTTPDGKAIDMKRRMIKAVDSALKTDGKEGRNQSEIRAKAAKKIVDGFMNGEITESLQDHIAEMAGFEMLTQEQRNSLFDKTEQVSELVAQEKWELAKTRWEELINDMRKMDLHSSEWYNTLLDIWYTGVLSGLSTIARSHKGSTLTAISHTMTKLMATNPKYVPFVASQMIHGWSGAFKTYGNVIKTGRSDVKFIDADLGKGAYTNYIANTPFGDLNGKDRAAKAVMTLPIHMYRTILAWDQVLNQGLREGFQAIQQIDRALDNNKSRTDVIAQVKKELALDRRKEAQRQAAEEVAQMKKDGEEVPLGYEKRRAKEILSNMRDQVVVQRSIEEGLKAALVSTPEGALGQVFDMWNTAITPTKTDSNTEAGMKTGLRLLLPFLRVGFNYANMGLDYTPIGSLRAYKGKTWTKGDGVTNLSPTDRRAVFIRSAIGTSIFTGILLSIFDLEEWELREDSWIEVTGDGTGNWWEQGDITDDYKPWSIRFKNPVTKELSKWYSYIDNPVGMALAPMGLMSDEIRFKNFRKDARGTEYVKNEIRGPGGLLATWAVGVFKYTSDQSFNQAMNNVMRFFDSEDPETMGRRFYQTFGRPVEGFYPNLYGQLYNQYKAYNDIPDKEANSWYEKIPAKVPFIDAIVKNDKYDVFGIPIVRDFDTPIMPEWALKMAKDNLTYREDNKYWNLVHKFPEVTVGSFRPDRSIDGERLTDDEQNLLQEEMGLQFRERVERQYDRLNQIDDPIKLQQALFRLRRDVPDRARRAVFGRGRRFSEVRDWEVEQSDE